MQAGEPAPSNKDMGYDLWILFQFYFDCFIRSLISIMLAKCFEFN